MTVRASLHIHKVFHLAGEAPEDAAARLAHEWAAPIVATLVLKAVAMDIVSLSTVQVPAGRRRKKARPD